MPVLPNAKHEAFAQAIARGLSASEAYVAAGYKESRSAASRLSTNVNIEARVAELLTKGAQRAEIDVARVLKELVRLGTSDIRNAFTEEGQLKSPQDWTDDFAASVASVEVVTRVLPGQADEEQEPQGHGGSLKRNRNAKVEYVHKIKVWDKNSALEKIAKHLGMFVEMSKVEHSGSVCFETVYERKPV